MRKCTKVCVFVSVSISQTHGDEEMERRMSLMVKKINGNITRSSFEEIGSFITLKHLEKEKGDQISNVMNLLGIQQ